MNIAHFSVTRPVAVTMRIAALVLLGIVCYTRLPVDLLPNVSLPTVVVSTSWPNVAPEEIEAQVTRPVERAVSSVPGLYEVNSTTDEGTSSVRVQLNWGVDVGQAAVDILQQVQRAKRSFPVDPTLEDPIVFKFDPSQTPILVYGVSGEKDVIKLRTLLDNEVAPILESAEGVAAVNVTGGEERAILVDVDPEKLRSRNLSLKQVSDRIAQENLNLPAGIAKQSETEYTIRSTGYFTSVKDIAKVPVGVYGGRVVQLGEIATIKDKATETRIYTRLNGEPAVGLLVLRQSGANTIAAAESIREKIAEAEKQYPNLQFRLAYDQSRFIENSIDRVKEDGIIGGVLAIIILLFFLRNVRSTLVVALSIPISVISTFALVYLCGFTLNTMSLSGLALAIGLIVDDAVVVLENIFRHMERDKKGPAEAAVTGAQEIMTAVVASTITIMIVFLPLLLIKGQSGQMFTQLALVVIFSIAVSLLDAITVVPMLASRLIKDDGSHGEQAPTPGPSPATGEGRQVNGHDVSNAPRVGSGNRLDDGTPLSRRGGGAGGGGLLGARKKVSPLQRFFDWSGARFDALDHAYRNGLRWSLGHRWVIVGGAFTACGLSLLLIPYVGVELMPQTDSGDFQLNVKMPIGTSFARTNEAMLQAEKILLDNPNVATVFSAAGTNLSLRGTSTSLNANQGAAIVKLKDDRKQSTQEVLNDLRKKLNDIAGAQPRLNQFDLVTQILTGGNQNVEVDIVGENLDTLSALSKDVINRVRDVPGYENVDVNWQDSTPELQWSIDRDKAAQLGLSFQDVATTIGTATNGNIASYYQENGFQYPIQVELPVDKRKTVDELLALPLTPSLVTTGTSVVGGASGDATATGANARATSVNRAGQTNSATGAKPTIELRQVARPKFDTGPSQITRLNRQRYIAVTGTPENRSAGDVQDDIEAKMKGFELPSGYRWDWGSNQKRRGQEFAGMGLAVFLAIALIYMLLASQFESFIHPLTILLAVPLSVIGVILALFISGRPFGLTAFIGLLLLVGIVVKNGILLIDYTNLLRERGRSRDDAVLEASPTRLRPILMTSLAAGFGMVPLALGLGEGSETQAPLATTVVGGLFSSTLLTLFVVPVVYTLFDDLARKLRGKDKDRDLNRPPQIVAPSAASVAGAGTPPGPSQDREPAGAGRSSK